MAFRFVLISSPDKTIWPQIAENALSPLGATIVASADGPVEALLDQRCELTVTILDAAVLDDVLRWITRLRRSYPELPIVVATTSPTWRRTRDICAASAYVIDRSSDVMEFRMQVLDILHRIPTPGNLQMTVTAHEREKDFVCGQ